MRAYLGIKIEKLEKQMIEKTERELFDNAIKKERKIEILIWRDKRNKLESRE